MNTLPDFNISDLLDRLDAMGVSRAQVAREVGTPQGHLWLWENRVRLKPEVFRSLTILALRHGIVLQDLYNAQSLQKVEHFGAWVREELGRCGMSIGDLVESTGMSEQAITALMDNPTRLPQKETCEKIERAVIIFRRTVTTFHLPDEAGSPVEDRRGESEGAWSEILVNRFERDPRLRRRCIAAYGTRCQVCDFDFETKYGNVGIGYIQVHHLQPLSGFREEHEVDPIKDMVPVCANCHAMLHQRRPDPFTIQELRSMLRREGSE